MGASATETVTEYAHYSEIQRLRRLQTAQTDRDPEIGMTTRSPRTISLDYVEVFSQAGAIAGQNIEVLPGTPWNAMSVICILSRDGRSAMGP